MRRRARAMLDEISGRGRLPVVAGGTGFYLRALFDGLFRGPARDAALRERLAAREGRKPGSLHRLLRRFDAATAARIHPNDVPKVMRALEVCLIARRPGDRTFPRRARSVGGIPHVEVRAGSGSGRALSPVRRTVPPHVRCRTGGGSTGYPRPGISARREAVRIAWLPPGGSDVARRIECEGCTVLRAAQHAKLCQAPDDLVS